MVEASWFNMTVTKLVDEMKPHRAGPNVVVGGVVGLLELLLAVALSALVFSGELSGLALLGTAVSCLLIALFSNHPKTS